jgi:hypothetical protein
MRRWLHNCQQNHRKCTPASVSRNSPTRLLEVSKLDSLRLIETSVAEQGKAVAYAALSYCWGGPQPFQLTQTNRSAMLAGFEVALLPQTLQDAVRVCRELNLCFLWIDALCIVQDDEMDRMTEIAKMPAVYGNATVSIAATSAERVSDGFLQPRQLVKDPEQAFKIHCTRQGIAFGSVSLFQAREPYPEPLYKRAWAFQERSLPPRTLEFRTFQVVWICKEANRDSNHTDGWMSKAFEVPATWSAVAELASRDRFRGGSLTYRFFHSNGTARLSDMRMQKSGEPVSFIEGRMPFYPNVTRRRTWFDDVTVYSGRKLTDVRDWPLAISGVAEDLGRRTSDTYLAGLWRSTLLAGLMWTPWAHDIEPRECQQPADFLGPSWSWLSFRGPVFWWVDGDPETIQQEAEILDARTKPLLAEAPYGAVVEGSARIKLRARMIGLQVGHSDSMETFLVERADHTICRIRAFLDADQDKLPKHVDPFYQAVLDSYRRAPPWSRPARPMRQLYLAELRVGELLSQGKDQVRFSTAGLILQQLLTAPATFERVGSFSYYTVERAADAMSEMMEESERRVERRKVEKCDQSWNPFSEHEPQVFTLV